MRQVVLDTETTGLDWQQGHRVIEIGCVEIVNRRRTDNTWHCYLNPERDIDEGAARIHGLTLEFLRDKPTFAAVAEEFLEYLGEAQLVIHNAAFDLGFLTNEIRLAGWRGPPLDAPDRVLDTLLLAREQNPGQRNSLDALCKRYGVDNSRRELHGALLDAELLADVYLAMTGGQAALRLGDAVDEPGVGRAMPPRRLQREGMSFVRLEASAAELAAHEAQLDLIDAASEHGAIWRRG